MNPKTLLRCLLVGLCCFVVAGCRADVSVQVSVDEAGAGTVVVELLLDAEASDAVADLESSGLALSDLAQTGWRLAETEELEDGSSKISAAKDFGSPEQFGEIMLEISGPDGIFSDFQLERKRGFARVEYVVSGTIDTSEGLQSFSDTELQRLLDVSIEEAAEQYGVSSEQVGVEFSVLLPGDITEGETNSPAVVEEDRPIVRWAVDLAADANNEVLATSEIRNVTALVLRGLAIVAGVLATLLLVAQVLRKFGSDNEPKKPSGKALPSASGRAPTPVTSSPAPSGQAGQGIGSLDSQSVILDGMGVLYQEGDDVNKLLIPFVRERGSILTNDEIWSKARALSLGRLTTNQFWKEVGLDGDSTAHDAAYASRHQLSPGVVRYMRALKEQDVKVGCVVNGASTWAEVLRSAHSLSGLIDPWIVSGSVGVRKPDQPMLEVVRRLCELPPDRIRFIDDDLDILDALRSQGYATTWYNPEGSVEGSRGHTLLVSFEAEARRLTAPVEQKES